MNSQQNKNTEFGNDYKAAIRDWKKFENAQKSLETTVKLIEQVESLLGPVVHVHVLDSGDYIGIKFSKREKVLSVWIHQNYVDHAVELEGSLPLAEKENVWRTQLMSSFTSASKVSKPAEVIEIVCPKCNMRYNRSNPRCTNCSSDA
jgi:hypothetical protein